MIGLTLVVSMGVFASSLKASFGDVLGDQVDADLYVVCSSAQAPGYSPSVVDEVAGVDGVDQVSSTGWGKARFAGRRRELLLDRPGTARARYGPEVSQGSLADLGEDDVMVAESAATKHGWKVGRHGRAEFAETGRHALRSRRSTTARAGSATTTS